ncbi:MAG: hypothetical protein ABSE73_08955 [Planctomycetota bacterium]
MAGRIKKGEGTLIGNAGEFYVAAELLKRGVVAALAPRNAPGVDILAAKGAETVRVRVKTKSSEYTDWQWVAKKDGSIFRNLGQERDFTVLVNLTPETKDLIFFVLPTSTLNEWLVADFEDWANTPGKKGRRHDRENNEKRHLSYKKFEQRLKPFMHNWPSIWERGLKSEETVPLDSGAFWQGYSLEQLANIQQVQPHSSLDELAGDWPAEDSLELFLATVQEARR